MQLSAAGLFAVLFALVMQPVPLQAQQAPTRPVKVTVVDPQGQPVVGAVVVRKGTTDGKTTDADGVATLSVPSGAELEIRFAGLKPQVVNVRDLKEIAVQMETDAQVADEVVVVGYGTQKKINVSGSVAVAPTEMLKSRSTTNVLSSLQGTVANLNISTSSGAIDEVPDINLRGMTTISGGSTAPLIVIDGVPATTTEFARLNSQDIESISVLKDPSTAAIYGSRAAFGAIVVTTKRGSGRLKVDYSSGYSFRSLGRLPEVVTDPEQVMTYASIFAKGWYSQLYSDEEILYAQNHKKDPVKYPAQYVDDNGYFKNLGETDWFHEIYDNLGFQTTQNLTLSGSAKDAKGKTVSYLLSGQYVNVNGMLRKGNDKFNQYNFRTKVDYEATKWLKIGNNTSFSDFTYDEPTNVANHGDGSFFHNVNRTRSLETVYNLDGSYTLQGAKMVGRLENGGRTTDRTQRFNTIFTAQATIFKDIWTINADAAFQKYNYRQSQWDAPVYYRNRQDGGDILSGYPSKTYAYNYDTYSQNTTYNIYTNYNQTFNEKHNLSATVGFNQESYETDNLWLQRDDLISSSLPTLDLATGEKTVGQSISEWATRGAFARIGYIYDNKYIFEVNGRYDGTSRFRHDDRFVFNPSGSLAWLISEEKFFEKAKKTINLLKLRASYGTVGNQNVGTYAYIPTMSSGTTSSILDGEQQVYVWAPGLVSSSLTWEQVRTLDVGAEINFFNNRLQLSGGWFRSWTEGMLTTGKVLPSVLGTSEPDENAADLRTEGWEINVKWQDQFMLGRHPFRYDIGFVLGDATSKITKFDNPTGTLSSYYEGYEMGEIWGYVTEGFFQSEEEIRNHADQTPVLSYPGTRGQGVGDIKFKDLDGDGEISTGKNTLSDPGDRKIIGNSRPHYNYSITVGAEWAGIDLRLYFQGVGQRDYYPSTSNHYFWGMYAQPWANLMVDNLDYWTPENPDAYFPTPKSYAAETSGKELGATQTRYLQDAGYCRLKNITIGYTFPNKWMEKIGIRNLRVYFSGENLITWTKLHKSLDPEGLDGLVYPYQKTYSFGLNLSF